MQASWLTPKASCFMTTRVLWEGACRDWCLPGRNRGAAGRHPVRRGRTSADAQAAGNWSTPCWQLSFTGGSAHSCSDDRAHSHPGDLLHAEHYEAFQLMSGCLRHNLKATHTLPSWHTVSPACEELASGGGGSAEGVCGTCMQRACGWRWRQRGRRGRCRSSWRQSARQQGARWRPSACQRGAHTQQGGGGEQQ
ncbi:hypothetical protein JKP88DRAFT_239253 [Tribonema minus]|uniref:Uncharacterized protein n=1 Tax=Tribonema minus TaxID=303371 RepID=A0A835Z436_9STRA|nr:hypothetical protein JKP88DRAFT_239253 [Tribonema minus]